MSMLSPFACVGVANRRDEAAQPALRPKAFLRKSRLFFMAFPLYQLTDQLSSEGSMELERIDTTAKQPIRVTVALPG
jgi:hypothetical protein